MIIPCTFFNLPVLGQQEIALNSTLIHESLALPGQRVVFTCIARNATILEWQSDEYIGRGGDNIQIYNVGDRVNVTSFINENTYATRDSVTVENGVTVIVSRLFIIALEQFPLSSITCGINGHGLRQTISFNTTGMEILYIHVHVHAAYIISSKFIFMTLKSIACKSIKVSKNPWFLINLQICTCTCILGQNFNHFEVVVIE